MQSEKHDCSYEYAKLLLKLRVRAILRECELYEAGLEKGEEAIQEGRALESYKIVVRRPISLQYMSMTLRRIS